MRTVRQETNVRVPDCAAAALHTVAARRDVSRDEAIRQVLDEYLAVQHGRGPDDRLTHISTVLRYPAVPLGRRQPRPGRVLRLRLAPGTADQLREVALQLPGQSNRAPREYQARTLTDAVMTAIALQEPFTDEFLHGLLPLLRQRAALGLWHWAAAVTVTKPEKTVLAAADDIRAATGPSTAPSAAQRHTLLVAESLEEDEAWHAAARFVVAANLARERLSGPGAAATERLLYEQTERWDQERRDLRELRDRTRYRGATVYHFDPSGRGAGAVWRAQRRVARHDFEDWLIARQQLLTATEYHVPHPGWWVNSPATWHVHTLPAAAVVPEPFATWRATGRVLAFPARNRTVLWPVRPDTVSPGCAPIPGVEPVLAAAARLRADRVSDFVEALLLDRERDNDDLDLAPCVQVPADKAVAWGFICDEERHAIMAHARAATLDWMRSIIQAARPDSAHRDELTAAYGKDRQFSRITKRIGIPFGVVRATWRWDIGSVVDALDTGVTPAALQWLAGYLYWDARRALRQHMLVAWDQAFDRSPGNARRRIV